MSIRITTHVKRVYGKIKLLNEVEFSVYAKDDSIYLSVYKSGSCSLPSSTIEEVYRLFRKISVYIGISNTEVDKIHNIISKYVDNDEHINIDVKI